MAKPAIGPRCVHLLRCFAPLLLIVLSGAPLAAQMPPGAPIAPGGFGSPPPPMPPMPGMPGEAPLMGPLGVAPPARPAEDMVVAVQVQGNRAVTKEKILAEIHTRAGRPYDPEVIEGDIGRLHKMRSFVSIKAFSQRVPGGRVVIFRLVERAILKAIIITGNAQYAGHTLKKELGFKVGDAADPYEVEEGRRKLEDFYHKKGYSKVRITILEGNKPGQLQAVYTIDEGPKQEVWSVKIVGAQIVDPWHIKLTVPKTKAVFLFFFGGDVDLKEIDEDCKRITAYYRSLGFFQAVVGRTLEYNEDQTRLTVTFVIDEGPRSFIRNIGLIGNTRFATPELMAKLKLASGKPFEQAALNADIRKIEDKYGAIGYVKAEVKGEPRLLEYPGQVDLVYNIHEGHPYRVGRISVVIKGEDPHTQLSTVLNRLSFKPGDIIDMREVRDSERRLRASGLFMVDPSKGRPPEIALNKPGKTNSDSGDDETLVAEDPDQPKRHGGYRGQSPDPSPADQPPPAERTLDIVYEYNSVQDLRRAEREVGVGAPPPAAWAAPGPVFAPPVNPYPPQYAPPSGAGAPLPYPAPLPPPSADPNWQPAPAPVPQGMAQPMVIRGQYTGDRGFSRPDITPTDTPTATAPSDAPAAAGDYSSGPAPANPPLPSYSPSYPPAQSPPGYYPPASPQYSRPPYSAPQPQPAYPPAVSQQAPLSSSGVTGQPWPQGGQGYLTAAQGGAPDQQPNGNPGAPNLYANPGAPNLYANPGTPNPYANQGTPNPYGNQGAPPNANQPPYGYQGAPPNANQPPYGYQGAPPNANQPPYGYQGAPPYANPAPPPLPGGFQPPLTTIFGSGSPVTEPSPNGEPFQLLDPRIISEETQTGRIMVGVGVNSDAGLVGNIVLEEHNFDWTRFPTSWEDVHNGSAWRGGGEDFRIECMPGTELQHYQVTYQQPYWFHLGDKDVSLGLSGFYNTRIFTQWEEAREGGRVGLGYQLTHDLTAGVAFIGENINISNPVVPTPAALTQVLGNNAMYGFEVSLQHNTLDSPFLATEGHLFKLSFEQVVGSYAYPQVAMQLSQYFKLSERADHTGCHVFMLSARAGYTGDETPIYDRFYAGGFNSIRGFEFRGVSPIDPVTGQQIGGDFQLLTTAQYMFPITPDDMLRGVLFVDAGTVEPTISDWSDKIRVAPGFGLRIAIPAMGPAPIALDFAFPIIKQAGDETQTFSFSVGLNY